MQQKVILHFIIMIKNILHYMWGNAYSKMAKYDNAYVINYVTAQKPNKTNERCDTLKKS